ncbi:MAG: SsrA-binding protein SmpB [Bacteroidia bacterium]
MSSKNKNQRIQIVNRKAKFNYHIEETLIAGMQLLGTEVKSIRNQQVNLGDGYCYVLDGELFIKNVHISEWKQKGFDVHEPLRERKLLLNKRELRKVESRIKTKGYSVFPIKLFESERGFFKLELGLGQGKKNYDKREDIKEKDIQRDIDRGRY